MVDKNSSSLNACTLLNNSNTVTATRLLGVGRLFLHYITPDLYTCMCFRILGWGIIMASHGYLAALHYNGYKHEFKRVLFSPMYCRY